MHKMLCEVFCEAFTLDCLAKALLCRAGCFLRFCMGCCSKSHYRFLGHVHSTVMQKLLAMRFFSLCMRLPCKTLCAKLFLQLLRRTPVHKGCCIAAPQATACLGQCCKSCFVKLPSKLQRGTVVTCLRGWLLPCKSLLDRRCAQHECLSLLP